jgi:hypothetical protein
VPVVSAPATAAVASATITSTEATVVAILALLLVASAAALVSKTTKASAVLAVATEMTWVASETLLMRLLRTALARGVLCGRSGTALLSAQGRRAGTSTLRVAERLQGIFAGSWLAALLLAIRALVGVALLSSK